MKVNGTPQQVPSYGWVEFTDERGERQKHLILEHYPNALFRSYDPVKNLVYTLALGSLDNVEVTYW